ncbi:MAG TPA: NAD(P)H-binding protein [Bryobacteraceae bacterium]|nr:NAD(P)H-binding protein [Bryobacteraceae bacterium]
MNRILVIGGTGTVGREVLAQLPTTGVQIRALTRTPNRQGIPPHVEVVEGDLTVPASLDRALDNIDTVFLVWVAPASAVEAGIDRIAKHARRIVHLSAPLKAPHPLFQQPNPSRTRAELLERVIEASGLEWTFLQPGMFAANALTWWAPQIRTGDTVRWPYLAAPTAPIDERDIATVAVRALCENGHGGASYVLTGPESLTQGEQLSTIARVIGRHLRLEDLTADEARRTVMADLGFPAALSNILLDAWAAAIGQPAYITSTFQEITGLPPRTFLHWATDHAAEIQARAASV